MYTWFDFYRYSLGLGFRYLAGLPGHRTISKEGIKRLVSPMDIARYFEIPATIREIEAKPGETILDLSSAKLVSLFLTDKVRCHVM